MSTDLTIKRLKELAGIKEQEPKLIVLLPKDTSAEAMSKLLAKLKEISGDTSKWNEIEIDGVTYVGTGVERDL